MTMTVIKAKHVSLCVATTHWIYIKEKSLPYVTIIDKRALMADFKIDLNNGKYQPVSALLDNHCF
uniref:Uncharacterized protein n=1 Tax=Amphimedon queenslandica TaxID=400682 RepID=A0A1X7UET9_AMPQE